MLFLDGKYKKNKELFLDYLNSRHLN